MVTAFCHIDGAAGASPDDPTATTEAAAQEAAMTGTTAPHRTVHLAVYDAFADWETGHAAAWLTRGGLTVRTVGPTTGPVTTLGGLRVTPDLALADLRPEDSALLVLPGSDLWDEGGELAPFAAAARAFLDAGVPVAAICGATAGLAREGLLDDRPHTSSAAGYLAATGYLGAAHYREADAVTAGDLITAGSTEPVAFAREVLGRLGVYEGELLDAWYRLFHDSDPTAYEVLAAAAGAGTDAGAGAGTGAGTGAGAGTAEDTCRAQDADA